MIKVIPNRIMKIGLHKLEDKIEILVILSSYNLVQFNYVGMF